MVTEILGVIDKVMGMINANQSQGEYANKLDALAKNQGLSESALLAKEILRERAGRNMPGYDTAKADINTMLPTSMNEARQWLTGPGMADYISRASAVTNQQLRNLNADNAQYMDNADLGYANFLGGTLAPMQDRNRDTSNMYELMGANADLSKAATNNEFMSSIMGLLGGAGDTDWRKVIALLSKQDGQNDLSGRSDTKFTQVGNNYPFNSGGAAW